MRSFNRALLVSAASLGAASVAQAQTMSLGSPVSASGAFASEDSLDRAALYTQSAFVAPQGRFGFTVQALGQSAKVEAGAEKFELRSGGAAFSGFYGLTNAITLGAGLPYSSQTAKISSGGLSAEDEVDGLGDVELFGRMRAYRSTTGATKLALGAGVTLPTADDAVAYTDAATYQVGAAMSHRVNRMTFHVAPDMQFVKDLDPTINMNLAGSFAATPRLAVSVEGLSRFQGAVQGSDADRDRTIDLGAGLRYNAVENLILDLGLRTNLSNSAPEGIDTSAGGLSFGFNWLF
jgi:hypothetical protein